MLSYSSRKNVIEGNLDQSSPKYDEYISGFNGILKEYQKNLLYAMKHLEENRHIKDSQEFETNFGIIADKTGSGKSISVLAHILNKPVAENKKNIQIDYKSSNDYLHLFDLKYNYEVYENTNLIVVNKILIKQWEKYIHQFTNITDYFSVKLL